LIMWIPVTLFMIVVMSILFIRWMQQQDQKQRQAEIEQDKLLESGSETEGLAYEEIAQITTIAEKEERKKTV
jgi:preprotein translocase subunit YajC